MRKSIVALAAVIAIISGCGAPLASTSDNAETAASPSATATEPAADPATTEPVEETTAPEPPSEEGTFENPYPYGTSVGNDEVLITLGKTEVGVDKSVRKANQFNDKAPKGMVYIRVPVSVKNVNAPEKITPWLEVDIALVAASGESYDKASVAEGSGGTLKSLNDVDDLYKGGKGKGYVYFAAPKSVVPTAVYSVSFSFSDEVFVKAR